MEQKITAKYLRDLMPEWKRKKDPLLVRYFTRPLSFYISAFLANHGVTANSVSYFSGLVALLGCIMYLPKSYECHLVGALLILIWLILDCVDGNLARSVKKQPFGEFADAISSYILVCFMCTAFGYAAYYEGGLFLSKYNPDIIVLGALGSCSDTLMRLIYHKYMSTESELINMQIMPRQEDVFKDHSKVGDWKVRLNMEFGVAGFLTIVIIICTIFRSLDLLVFYCFLYYGGSCLGTYIVYVRKAIKNAKTYGSKMT